MARIRTIKPEFFTSADIVSLSPLARLLYIALWCEADREGRMVWKPATFKLRYFPGDSCDMYELCGELVSAGLVVLYGKGLAYIPAFHRHQHLNPRESVSSLPNPDASPRVDDASPRDSDAQGGREGKGREGKEISNLTVAPARPEVDRPLALVDSKPKGPPDCPHAAVLALWAEVLPAMPQHLPSQWRGSRADHLRARWRETAVEKGWTNADDGLAYLRKLFGYVGKSRFLTGQAPNRDPTKRPFVVELEWLVSPTNWAKVIEGKYHEGAA